MYIDSEYYSKFIQILDNPDFFYFTIDRDFRNALQSGNVKFDQVKYKLLPQSEVISKRMEMIKQLEDLLELESNEDLAFLYRQKLKERATQLKLFSASLNMSDADNSDIEFSKATELLYGAPKKEIFDRIVVTLRNKEDNSSAFKNYLDSIRVESKKNVFETTTDPNLKKEFSQIEKMQIQDDIEYTSTEILKIFNKVIEQESFMGWKAVFSRDSSSINVNTQSNLINIPSNKIVSGLRLKKLIAHELLVHLRRSYRGRETNLEILKTGLYGYDRAEEGLAIAAEQLFDQNNDISDNFDSYFTISVIYGLDGRGKKDFYQAFEVIKTFYQNSENDPIKVHINTYNRLIRAFRGTMGRAGVCFTKDLIYLEGNLLFWEWYKKEDFKPNLFSGKYNFFDENQVSALRNLDIV